MAASGLVLVGFIIGHLAGNLQIFLPPERMNAYAYFLEELGPWLWVARIFLLFALVVHVWTAVALTLENQKARPVNYGVRYTIRATLASRTMRLTGLVVLAFIGFHLAQFTFRVTHPEYRDLTYQLTEGVHRGETVRDVYSMVVLGFQSLTISGFYLIAIGLLSVHLAHGLDSAFQTFGLRNAGWSRGLRHFSVWFSVLYFLGNAAIPLAVLLGVVAIPDKL